MTVTELTTEEEATGGVRRFMIRGQVTRCEITVKWEQEVDADGIPRWQPVECRGTRLIIEELGILQASLRQGWAEPGS